MSLGWNAEHGANGCNGYIISILVLVVKASKVRRLHTYAPDAARATALLAIPAMRTGDLAPSDSRRSLYRRRMDSYYCRGAGRETKIPGGEPRDRKNPWSDYSCVAGVYEMLYQYETNYVLNSEKFEKRFDFHPTPYLTRIREVLKSK